MNGVFCLIIIFPVVIEILAAPSKVVPIGGNLKLYLDRDRELIP